MKERLQKRIDAVQKFMLKPACSKWSALYGGLPIVESVMQLPRRGDILVELGLLSKEEMKLMQPEHNGFIDVLIRFPITMLQDATKTELLTKGKRSQTSGCLQMESFNLCEIPAEVPILIWCHGGGLTLGSFDDPDGIEAVSSIVGLASTFGKSKSGIKHPPAVVVSVEYRLAPEHPFPAAPIDCLSVAYFLLELAPSHEVHVGGVSAGGYLAAVTALESFRRFPGQVGSLYAIAPMLGPGTDSLSFYLESRASINCPVEAIRWCWQSYLELDGCDHTLLTNAKSRKDALTRNTT